MKTLINTGALARCKHAASIGKVFQHFLAVCRRPLVAVFAHLLSLLLISRAFAATHYVDVNSTNSALPYASWATAAVNIQDAIDAAGAGDEIIVTNGTYISGGRNSSRVAVDKPLSVWSVNGPQFTIIDGGYDGRCAYLTNGAALTGFTLTNGLAAQGGGLWCESTNALVSNCVITRNQAYAPIYTYGGGAYGGTLNNCTLTDNSAVASVDFGDAHAYGGAACFCTLNNCELAGNLVDASSGKRRAYAYGGGAYSCILNDCTLTNNEVYLFSAANPYDVSYGGGAYQCTLNNCTLMGNWADTGGGTAECTLNNCTLTRNSAYSGGGASGSFLANCIVYFNDAGTGPNYAAGESRGVLINCCAMPYFGDANITNAPLFVDDASGNLRLQSNSPCINAGMNAFAPAGPELDGNPRIVGGTVDIGAYEYQSLDLIGAGAISNQFGFSVTGQSNWVIVLEASSDFTTWTPLTTNTLSGSPFPFSDSTPPNLPQRFYRARMK